MTTFILIAALMLAAAMVWLLVPLLRHARTTAVAQDVANLDILRDQLAELEADLANGTLTREQYEPAQRELEQRVLEDTRTDAATSRASTPFAGALTAAILAGALPIGAMLLYFTLGSHAAFSPAAKVSADAAEHQMTPQKVTEMAAKLAARLEKEPDNAEGWTMLAHTYYALKRFPDAVTAFERATTLNPGNADLLADYADALAAVTNTIEGKPLELVRRALAIDPTQWKALALAGTNAFNQRDFKAAVAYWEMLKQSVPPESEMARSIDASIAEAKSLSGMKASAAPGAAAASTPTVASAATATSSASAKSSSSTTSVASSASASGATASAASAASAAPPAAAAPAKAPAAATITGTVTLSPALAATAAPNDTVFIFARAAQGPRMPLAILRKQVKDLPLEFSLDDSMAMAPEMKLSKFSEVVVGARVSKSGNATPQSGDLEGASKPVAIGTRGVVVQIDTVRP